MSVSKLLEWFEYTGNVMEFQHCWLRVCQQGGVCRRLSSTLSNLVYLPVQYSVFVLDSPNSKEALCVEHFSLLHIMLTLWILGPIRSLLSLKHRKNGLLGQEKGNGGEGQGTAQPTRLNDRNKTKKDDPS